MSANVPAAYVAHPAPPAMGFLEAAITTFEGIDRLAKLMAVMGTMPEHLRDKPADCFRIVVQAAKWRMDPFAVAECTSLVHGRLCFEGKLIAAALSAMHAIEGRLSYEVTGTGQDASIVVTGTPRGGKPCSLSGSVRAWRTSSKTKDGKDVPNAWDKQPEVQLIYRGTRQWARLYAPEAILGVYAPEEIDDEREVELLKTETIHEPVPARIRDVPPVQAEADRQPAAAAPPPATPGVPTAADLDKAARSLHAEFKDRAVTELRAITAKLGIAKISDCPPEKIGTALEHIAVARRALHEGG